MVNWRVWLLFVLVFRGVDASYLGKPTCHVFVASVSVRACPYLSICLFVVVVTGLCVCARSVCRSQYLFLLLFLLLPKDVVLRDVVAVFFFSCGTR